MTELDPEVQAMEDLSEEAKEYAQKLKYEEPCDDHDVFDWDCFLCLAALDRRKNWRTYARLKDE